MRIVRRLLLLRPLPDTDHLPPAAEPAFGPLEAEAVEKALQQWVRLQKSESKVVPARRVDSD